MVEGGRGLGETAGMMSGNGFRRHKGRPSVCVRVNVGVCISAWSFELNSKVRSYVIQAGGLKQTSLSLNGHSMSELCRRSNKTFITLRC